MDTIAITTAISDHGVTVSDGCVSGCFTWRDAPASLSLEEAAAIMLPVLCAGFIDALAGTPRRLATYECDPQRVVVYRTRDRALRPREQRGLFLLVSPGGIFRRSPLRILGATADGAVTEWGGRGRAFRDYAIRPVPAARLRRIQIAEATRRLRHAEAIADGLASVEQMQRQHRRSAQRGRLLHPTPTHPREGGSATGQMARHRMFADARAFCSGVDAEEIWRLREVRETEARMLRTALAEARGTLRYIRFPSEEQAQRGVGISF